MEILRCPMCRAELSLEATRTEGTEVVTGTLRCTKCHTVFPIEDGIPDLLPPEDRD
ncbi:MAG: methytransferase partner Trm112 [Thermoplasmatales archaeon]|nr:methytransferase partner Trm112 [Thermoplasmatales archaeon]